MAEPLKPGDFATVIGPDANFKGELTFDGGVRIEGKFEGKVNTKGKLHVGKGAQIKADLSVGSVQVEGQVQGNVTAGERLELAASGQVLGDIRTPRLAVTEGATLVGNCNVSPDALKNEPPKTAHMPEREMAGLKR